MRSEKSPLGSIIKKAIFGILIAVIAIALIFSSPMFIPKQIPSITTATVSIGPTPTLPPEVLKRLAAYQKSPDDIATRPQYFGNETAKRFSQLPSFPADFYAKKLLFEYGQIPYPHPLLDKYWKQPEFYPEFERSWLKEMQTPPERFRAFGYGGYPMESVTFVKKGEKTVQRFLIYSSPLIQTYQGVTFNIVYPKEAQILRNVFKDGTKFVTQDPEITANQIRITLSPVNFVLGPGSPIMKQDWAHLVEAEIDATNAPAGKYAIAATVITPPVELQQKWSDEYGKLYTNAASYRGNYAVHVFFVQVE